MGDWSPSCGVGGRSISGVWGRSSSIGAWCWRCLLAQSTAGRSSSLADRVAIGIHKLRSSYGTAGRYQGCGVSLALLTGGLSAGSGWDPDSYGEVSSRWVFSLRPLSSVSQEGGGEGLARSGGDCTWSCEAFRSSDKHRLNLELRSFLKFRQALRGGLD
jgi:hypothetical protein